MALVPNLPIYAPLVEVINGLNISFASSTTVGVAAGQATDSQLKNLIVLDSAVVINAAVNGANGLDQGSLANSTFYAVHVIADSTGYNDTAAMLSTSATNPLLPAGYDMFRRVGSVLTSGAAAILDFTQRGNGNNRHMYYAAAIATDITAGASTTFAAVNCSASVPVAGKEVYIKAVLTADAGGLRNVALRDGGSSSAAGQAIMSAPASTVMSGMLVCPCGASGDIDYLVSNASASVALSVQGYLDAL